VIFVDWKSEDNEHHREASQIMAQISDKDMKINTDFGKYGNELTFLDWTRLQNVESFPVLKESVPQLVIKYSVQPSFSSRSAGFTESIKSDVNRYGGWQSRININNFDDYLTLLKNQSVTHLIIDTENNVRFINDELRSDLKHVFDNEEMYPFLIKEYDSKEKGFKYHLKLFKIDYIHYEQLKD
jgi:hypothetical protein